MRTRTILLTLLAVLLAGCGSNATEPDTEPPVTPTPVAGLGNTCNDEGDGFSIDYPKGWHTNSEVDTEPCRWFHPAPFDYPLDTENLTVAINIRFESVLFDDMAKAMVEGPGEDVRSRRELTVAGMRAVRVEVRSTETVDALLPPGTLVTQYAVEFKDRTMVATANSMADEGTYEGNVEVLDEMMQTISILEADSGCSADPINDEVRTITEQPGLPEDVATKRREIFEAAVECDYERLRKLTGTRFSFSFGAEGDAIAYWKRLETESPMPKPLHAMAAILLRPHGTLDTPDGKIYVWPSAFAYKTWDEVPEEDREALKPLYDEEDFRAWDAFGSYIGYRIGIDTSGDWKYFIAGD